MPPSLGFLDLPAEIRHIGYSLTASENDSIVNRPLPAAAVLLPTCRTVYNELLVLLFSSKLVVFDNHSGELGFKEISTPQVSDSEPCSTKDRVQLNPLAAESVVNATYKVLPWSHPIPMHDIITFEHKKLQRLFERCPNIQSLRLKFHYDDNKTWVVTLLHLAVLIIHSKHTNADKTRLGLHHLHVCPGCRAPHLSPGRGAHTWSLQYRLDKGVLCDPTSILRLRSKLRMIDVVPPTKDYSETCCLMRGYMHKTDDLIASLRLPQQHALTRISGTSSDERWNYELKSVQPGSTGQALDI